MADEGEPGRRAPGELGAAVWSVLEQAGRPMTAREVQRELGGAPAYSTIITTLGRMWAKGTLTRERDGRSHRYAPVSDEAGLAARRMRGVLDGRGDRSAVLARFVSDLDSDDEVVLRRLLAAQDTADGPGTS